MAYFLTGGEFSRGKGGKQSRTGPRSRVNVSTGTIRLVEHQSPEDIAGNRLVRVLEGFGEITRPQRYAMRDLMVRSEQLPNMNMRVLAHVLRYMQEVGDYITPQNFNYQLIAPDIEKLLPRKEVAVSAIGVPGKVLTPADLQIMRLRLAATFLRYLRLVLTLKQRIAAESATILQQQMAPTT